MQVGEMHPNAQVIKPQWFARRRPSERRRSRFSALAFMKPSRALSFFAFSAIFVRRTTFAFSPPAVINMRKRWEISECFGDGEPLWEGQECGRLHLLDEDIMSKDAKKKKK